MDVLVRKKKYFLRIFCFYLIQLNNIFLNFIIIENTNLRSKAQILKKAIISIGENHVKL